MGIARAGGMVERTMEVGGVETWLREMPGEGTPIVFWHGNPTDADDWLPFMEAASAPCFAADMPAFGRSAAPPAGEFGYTMDSYADWAEALLDELGLDRVSFVVHDWGSIGLFAALRQPERVERVVAFNIVPFGVDYRWHPIARWCWRRRWLGEAFNGAARGPVPGLVMRQARPGFRPMPSELLDRVSRNFARPAMRAAVLALYRSADPAALEAAGRGLHGLAAPALLLWAQRDPYIGALYGRRLAEILPRAELVEVEGAGHWSWLDRPDLVETALAFLEGGPSSASG